MASYHELAGALEALARAARHGRIDPRSTLLAQAEDLVAAARRNDRSEHPWTAFTQTQPLALSEAALRAASERIGVPLDDARAMLAHEIQDTEVWINSRYQVLKRPWNDHSVYLSIKRLDQKPIRSWRDLQRIKNELVNPECEGIELFPAETRLLDMANQYHLFVLTDPNIRLPWGHVAQRLVSGEEFTGPHGQEPLES